MSDQVVRSGSAALDEVTATLRAVLASDPGVGFSVVDLAGVIRFANARATEMFLGVSPEKAIGSTLDELYGRDWAAERITVLERVLGTGRPALLRHIRRGKQLQSTIRLLSSEQGSPQPVSVVTVEGEHDPSFGDEFHVIESGIMDLGPLAPLTAREREVLSLVGHGMSTNQMAAALFRSPRTIERHLDSIRQKLHTASRLQLVSYATAAGLEVRDATLKRTSPNDTSSRKDEPQS